MSVLRPYRLERELDSAFYHWLAWLPQWQPELTRPRRQICRQCPPFVDALGFDDIAHGPLHALFAGVDTLIRHQFDRELAAQYPELLDAGWSIELHQGGISVSDSDGLPLDQVLEAAEHGISPRTVWPVTFAAAADARSRLNRSYWSLFEMATARLGLQKTLILRAIDAHVEPKVRRLADEMIAEVCAEA